MKRALGYEPNRFDVLIGCACGWRVLIYTREPPEAHERFRCTSCGALANSIEYWPIWARGTRGDPRNLQGIEKPMGEG